MRNRFTRDDLISLSSILGRLEGLCASGGFELKEEEPLPNSEASLWGRKIDFTARGEGNSFLFRAYKREGSLHYQVCGGGTYEDSFAFWVKEEFTDDVDNAIKAFADRLVVAKEGQIPQELLIEQMVWRKEPVLIPPGYEKEIPLLTSTGTFRLYHGAYLLEVRRSLHTRDFTEDTHVCYNGFGLIESVSIKNGKIVGVNNSLSRRAAIELRNKLGLRRSLWGRDPDGLPELMEGDSLPAITGPTYHQLKSFEGKLRELPDSFQGDLQAIYEGNGRAQREVKS